MYTYVSSQLLPQSPQSPSWLTIDISQTPVYKLYRLYREIYIEVSTPALPHTLIFPFHEKPIKDMYYNYKESLSNLLIEIQDKTLPTVDSFPPMKEHHVRYEDVFRLDYGVIPCKIGVNTAVGYPESELNDIKIYRKNTEMDIRYLHLYGLISVNGYLHYTQADLNYTYVVDANKTRLYSQQANIGIHSFFDIGEITKILIQSTWINPISGSLYKGLYITLPDTYTTTNKTVWLSLGGYMIPLEDNVWDIQSQNTYRLYLSNMPYIERVLESLHFLDMSHIGLDNIESVKYDMVTSDDFIIKYLTELTQTFVFIVNVDNLNTRKYHLRKHTVPGHFLTYNEPYFPMITGYGKIAEYWKTYKDGIWSARVMDGFDREMLFYSYGQGNIEIGSLKPKNANKTSRGYLLDIFSV